MTAETVPAAASQVYRSRSSELVALSDFGPAVPSAVHDQVVIIDAGPRLCSRGAEIGEVAAEAARGGRGELTDTCRTGNGLPPQSSIIREAVACDTISGRVPPFDHSPGRPI